MTGRDEKALFVLSRINGLSQGKEILQEIKLLPMKRQKSCSLTAGWLSLSVSC